MKRSEINALIREFRAALDGICFRLPPFCDIPAAEWKNLGPEYNEIRDRMLGWDITDFGSGDFKKTGLQLVTIRNGKLGDPESKTYAEKIMLVRKNQVTPLHFHWSKMEDIINRGGGDLEITVYNSLPDGELDRENDVHLTLDGKRVSVPAGGKVVLTPGTSITLMPGQYHQWIGIPGTGPVMLFEVSSTNDDTVDNRFYDAQSRIPEIEEDEPAEYLIFNDYKNYVKF